MLTKHRTILEALEQITEPSGMCANFYMIGQAAEMPDRSEVRRITRHLARRGFAEFHRGLWTEDGEPAGSGYCITEAGRRALEEPGHET